MFLGTPHRGSGKTGLAEIVANVARVSLRKPNDKLVGSLSEESDFLEKQRESFTNITKSIPVVCLWEENPTAIGVVCL